MSHWRSWCQCLVLVWFLVLKSHQVFQVPQLSPGGVPGASVPHQAFLVPMSPLAFLVQCLTRRSWC